MWKAPKKNRSRCKKTWTKTQGSELEAETNFKGQCIHLEVYIFNLGTRASDKFVNTMEDLERRIGATCSSSCQPSVMTKTPENFPDPEMLTIIPDTGAKRPNTDGETRPQKQEYWQGNPSETEEEGCV